MVTKLTAGLHNTCTRVAFDNFFSSVQLLVPLLRNQIYATATVRPNRLELPVLACKCEQMDRGNFKWRISTSNNISYVKWKYMKAVHVISTAFNPTDTAAVSRKKKDGTTSSVMCPSSVVQYTMRIMDGVDQFNQRREVLLCQSWKSQMVDENFLFSRRCLYCQCLCGVHSCTPRNCHEYATTTPCGSEKHVAGLMFVAQRTGHQQQKSMVCRMKSGCHVLEYICQKLSQSFCDADSAPVEL